MFLEHKKDGAPRTAFQSREKGGRYARPRLYSGGSPAGSVCGGGAGEDPPLCAAACGVEIRFPFFHPDENQCLSGFGNQAGRVME